MLSEQVLPGCRGELHRPKIYYSEDLSGTVASASEGRLSLTRLPRRRIYPPGTTRNRSDGSYFDDIVRITFTTASLPTDL
jgi:hypothetical protein